jgi:Arc/MetJ family transcription regulator
VVCRSFYGDQQQVIRVGKHTARFVGLTSSHGSPPVIFKGVRDGKPYPEHGLSYRQWSQIPPRQIRLDELVTTTTVLALDRLLSEDSTFYGDLFPHAVRWQGVIYLEDGLHRAVRAALRNRTVLHARVHDMDT